MKIERERHMIKDVMIKGKEKIKKQKEGYYVKIEFMYGDADGGTKKEFGPFYPEQKKYLLHFLNMLEDCLNAYPNGKGGFDEYEEVVEELKVWNLLYEEDDVPNISDEFEKVVKQIRFEWICDPNGFYNESTIVDYKVRYFNKQDQQFHNVELIKE